FLTLSTVAFLSLTSPHLLFFCFFFNAPPTPEIYTLSLHDALPICVRHGPHQRVGAAMWRCHAMSRPAMYPLNPTMGACTASISRSEEHTSELQSRSDLVCRLLLEKKKKKIKIKNKIINTTKLHVHS